MRSFDVAIIGAGAAGLAAASRLAGSSIAIIEARDRVGGRVHTVRDAKFVAPIELGAEFIHSREGEVWKLLESVGGRAYFADGDHFQLRGKSLRKDNAFWDDVGKALKRLERLRGRDVSFAQFIRSPLAARLSAKVREAALAFIEGFDAAPAGRISALSIARTEGESDGTEGEDSFRVLGGYDQVVRALQRASLEQVSLFLKTVVQKIRWRRGQVEILVRDAPPIRARRVIVTLPVGVLRSESVTFEPDLPQKREAWRMIEMGQVVKVIARFREPFWETRRLPNASEKGELKSMAFMHAQRAAFPTWWSHWPVRGDVLTAWAGGPAAARLALRPRREILASAMDSLSRITGFSRAKLNGMLVAAHVADWQADPFSRGAYSYIAVGGIDAPKALAKPVERTLFFAGEATAAEGLGGTVDAALASGYRAADEVRRGRKT